MVSKASSAAKAASLYRIFGEGKPDLLKTGIHVFDRVTGGLGPGGNLVVGATNGIGKSLIMLDAAWENQGEDGTKTGLVSTEDTPDVIGCRILARESGVDSRRIRTKNVTDDELAAIQAAMARLEDVGPNDMEIEYAVGGSIDDIRESMKKLKKAGCKVVWVDYLQKIRAFSGERRVEVGNAFALIHREAVELEVGIVITSQIKRVADPTRIPTRFDLKESGDIENESRAIIMLGRPPEDKNTVYGLLDKSTVGGEGTRLMWRRGPCGSLFQREGWESDEEPSEEEGF